MLRIPSQGFFLVLKVKRVLCKLNLWSLALLLILGITCCTEPALASGQLVDLSSRQGQGHLVFRVLARHEIDYCIRIADADKAEFADASIDEQTKMGLSLWLAAAEQVTKQ